MEEGRTVVRVEADPSGEGWRVLSPGVGWWCDPPRAGALLAGGGEVGSLLCLNRRTTLRLPEETTGCVVGPLPGDRRVPVEFAETLFRLRRFAAEALDDDAGSSGASRSASELEAGTWAVVSPTDGVFYRGPGPQAPPFVELGSRVRVGHPVGLVEVMKTFNQVVYGGPGLPAEAEVVEIRCEDAEEIRAGQVLVVVR